MSTISIIFPDTPGPLQIVEKDDETEEIIGSRIEYPGADISYLSEEIQDHINAVWTAEYIATWGRIVDAEQNVFFPKTPGAASVRLQNQDGSYRREPRDPGSDISDLTQEMQDRINGLWTAEYIAEWQALVAANTPPEKSAKEKRAAQIEAAKTEAYRRILKIAPEWKQRNLTAQATQLLRKGEAKWTAEDKAAWEAGDAIWQEVAAIRAKADALEAMDPFPPDYRNDKYWT